MVLTDAIAFAAKCHEKQLRKGTDIPYIVHPMEACAIVATINNDQDLLIAAVLHDVIEDCGITEKELKARFGEKVAVLVACESATKEANAEASWRRRREETILRLKKGASDELQALVLADKLSNMRAIARDYKDLGDGLWTRFNQTDKKEHAWYYRSIRDNLTSLCDTNAFVEFSDLVDQVFPKEQA